MQKMFIHVAKKATFTSELQEQYDNCIVFIKDSQEIYTHGQFYAIPEAYKNKINSLEQALGALKAAKAFSRVSDGVNTAESPSHEGTLKFNKGANVNIAVSSDGVTISATDTKYTSGTGIKVEGTAINHSNAVAAGTAKGDDDKTLAFGGTFTIPSVTYDAQGHITGKGVTTMTMPAAPSFVNHTAKNVVTNKKEGLANSATTNNDTFLNLVENNAVRSAIQLKGSGKVSVSATEEGIVTIQGNGVSATSGSANGTIAIDGQNVAVKGLGSAAYTNSSDYATAAQGTKADNAVPNTRKVNGHVLSADVNVTKADVGLGNVTNESKATMFTSPVFTGTPTAPTAGPGTNTQQLATTAFVISEVGNKISAAQALRFKGTVGTDGDVTELPATHTVGDTYVVKTTGNYAGEGCEPGDMIICVKTGSTAVNTDWSVIQRNINGAVTGTGLNANQLILGNGGSTVKTIANGTNGQVLKMSNGTPQWAWENNYTLPAATDDVLGGIKTGYTANGRNYAVDLDDNNKAFVNVPWADTNTTYTFANGTNGSFSVTPSGGQAQTVTIGKPSTAGTADVANSTKGALTISLNGQAQTAVNGSAPVAFNITAGSV